jgi:hypothetical protein
MLSGDIPARILFLSDSVIVLQVNFLWVIFTPELVLLFFGQDLGLQQNLKEYLIFCPEF